MSLDRADRATEIEAKLCEHPGVRKAAIFTWRPAYAAHHQLVAYVVPNNDYLDQTLSAADDETRRIQKWKKTYDLTQLGQQSSVSQPDFNILGWNSTYTRQPIAEAEMREWVDLTVQEILKCEPSEVLEIGCGTGLLLLRIAGRCKRYVGVDNAHAVLETLKRQMLQLGGDWTQVELLERSADRFDGFRANSFDTIISNSAIQYFPSLNYLLKVLEQAVEVVKPGGTIFLGDLRSLPLQGLFAASVELFQVPPEMTIADLRDRIRKRIRLDEQLVLSPALFLALQQRWPKIASVEIEPRRGQFDNEMNRYRFNARLRIGAAPAEIVEPTWISCQDENLTLESIAKILKKQNPDLLAIAHVPNRRIEKDLLAFSKLQTQGGPDTVASFQQEIQEPSNRSIDPQDLWSLGEQLGYDVRISWVAARPDGTYDVAFCRPSPLHASATIAIRWPQPASLPDDLALYANAPTKAVPREKLLQQLREYCRQNLPEALQLSEFILLHSLPLAPDGTVDHQSLPSPDGLYA